MPGPVFLSGGSGFVGSAVIAELVSRRYAVHALVNQKPLKSGGDGLRSFPGGLFDDGAIDAAMSGCDAAIHLVGIIMQRRAIGITFERMHVEGTMRVVDAAKRNGVKRIVHMSALGSRPDALSDYHKTKWRAEEYVRASGLDWTIIRPSLIHGPGGEFMKMEAQWSHMKAPPPVFFMPFMPYFGGKHAGMLQPVYVGDVARAFVDCLENRKSIGEVFPLGGSEKLTWPKLHHAISQAVVGRKRMVLSMPVPVAKLLAAIGIGGLLGFNRDQVLMSQEDNTTDLTKFTDAFGWTPQPFEQTLQSYARQL
jgi:nucleoside-diphosphate-sugar epimerase